MMFIEMHGDGRAERAKFRRHTAFARETNENFIKGLEQDELTVCDIIRSCLIQDVKYHVKNKPSARKM